MVESGPAVMKKATSKTSTTPRASRLCARLGDKLERMKCCSSGTTVAVFSIGATRSGWNARHEARAASPPVYLICGALVSIYEATGLARPDVGCEGPLRVKAVISAGPERPLA